MISLIDILREIGVNMTRKYSVPFKNGTIQVAQGYQDKDNNVTWKAKNKKGKIQYFYGSDAKERAQEYTTNTDEKENF